MIERGAVMVKNSGEIGGARDIRSMRSICRRSMPRSASSAYLELYVLGKEKERSEKEEALLKKRGNSIHMRLAEIEEEMAVLGGLARRPSGQKAPSMENGGGAGEKKWKTFKLDY